MLKRSYIIFVLAVIFITGFHSGSRAADLSVGATAWYTAWDYKDDASSDVEYDPSILYGPVISAAFTPDLSMSFVFLYGKFDMNVGSGETMWLKRFDSDLTLNYRLNGFLKVFAGIKLIGFTWPEDGKHLAAGPGLGLSSVVPVVGSFFILGNISGLYLRGEEEGTKSYSYSADATEYGYNASLSLAYYIPQASTTVSLGGRYQYVKIDYTDESVFYSDSVSRFYGVTLTAVYTFNI